MLFRYGLPLPKLACVPRRPAPPAYRQEVPRYRKRRPRMGGGTSYVVVGRGSKRCTDIGENR
jgi:hypothetical protein